MARGFSSRGGSGRGGASRQGGAPKSNGGGSRPKAQIKGGNAVQYSIKGPKGETKYIGTTNNPTRRAAEHRESGKMGSGDRLKVETRAVSRPKAERLEAAKLRTHRRVYGGNPEHNTTSDGKYHLRSTR